MDDTGNLLSSLGVCPALCLGNGAYRSGVCKCYKGWKGDECQVPTADCHDPTCGGHGRCVDGECICAAGYAGTDCTDGQLPFCLLVNILNSLTMK